MKNFLFAVFGAALLSLTAPAFAVGGASSFYTDAAGDIHPGIATAGGTADILGMEVSNSSTDIVFTLTLNGNVASVDWAKFAVGIATGSTNSTNTGNGWGRPLQLNSPIGGMDYWFGAWVYGGGGTEFFSYNGTSWTGPSTLSGFSVVPGSTSTLTYTLSLSSLGLSPGDTFYFDAYSSGGGDGDSAIDSLANPNVSVSSWGQTYTSSTVGSGGTGLNAYTLTSIPEPATSAALLGAFSLAFLALRRRPRV
jgi:hypothetical protein